MAPLDIPARELALSPAPTVTPSGALSPSPYNFLFTGEDHLRITSYNSQPGVIVAVQGRMWHPEHEITAFGHAHVPLSDRSARSELFAMGEGYLLNLSVFAQSGSPRPGQTFVRVQVIRGFSGATYVLGTLVQDYITGGQDVAWPGSTIRRSDDGPGYPRTLEGALPALGAQVAETVPTGATWEIVTFAVELTTDATVAGRRPVLQYVDSDGVTPLWRWAANDLITASLQRQVWFAAGCALGQGALTQTAITGALPLHTKLLGGQSIRTATDAMQAGDQYSRPDYIVIERLEGS